jgi:hypothetical protein
VIQQGLRFRDTSTGAIVVIAEIKVAGVILSYEHDDPRKAGGRLLEGGQVEDLIRDRRLIRILDY